MNEIVPLLERGETKKVTFVRQYIVNEQDILNRVIESEASAIYTYAGINYTREDFVSTEAILPPVIQPFESLDNTPGQPVTLSLLQGNLLGSGQPVTPEAIDIGPRSANQRHTAYFGHCKCRYLELPASYRQPHFHPAARNVDIARTDPLSSH